MLSFIYNSKNCYRRKKIKNKLNFTIKHGKCITIWNFEWPASARKLIIIEMYKELLQIYFISFTIFPLSSEYFSSDLFTMIGTVRETRLYYVSVVLSSLLDKNEFFTSQ